MHLGWVGVFWEVPEAPVQSLWASLEAQRVKRLPAMTWVRSLGGEDTPGEGNAKPLHSLAWRIPWMEKPGSLQPMGLQRVRHN